MKLVWIDLETTGLNPSKCQMLEVACIITDEQLNVLEEYTSIINPGVLNYEPVAEEMHKKSGLFTKIAAAPALSIVETALMAMIKRHEPRKHRAYLAGSSPHFDRNFISTYMPTVDQYLCSRHLDVNAVGLAMRIKYGKELSEYIAVRAHRALDDIRRSISELKYYMDNFTKDISLL